MRSRRNASTSRSRNCRKSSRASRTSSKRARAMADWNPALYRRFEDERTRPARELLARVPLESARLVYDLGCGPGNSTELLVQRFPGARVVGLDNSPAMLESAHKRLPGT